MRGRERGARTMAMPPLRPKASLPSSTTTTFRLLLRMRGNGCAGSRPSGESTGETSSLKYFCSQRFCFAVQLSRVGTRMPALFKAGRRSSFQSRYCSSTSLPASECSFSNASFGSIRSGSSGAPNSSAVSTVATRTSKNSSRLVQAMHRYFRRSSRGIDLSCAWARTRKLNSSCESSRLRKSSPSGASLEAVIRAL